MARSDAFILRHVTEAHTLACRVDDDGRVVEAAAQPGLREIALVPADRCSVVRVNLPEMTGSRLQRALRWAVEDAIAGDPEAQHVVPLTREPDGRLACLVVARADMDRWLAALPRRPWRLCPDAACLPGSARDVVLMPLGESVLARAPGDLFDRLETDLLEDVVPELLDGADGRLVWIGEAPPPEMDAYEPDVDAHTTPGLPALAAQAAGDAGARYDLMRGDYAPAERRASPGQWRRVGWLAALLVFLVLAAALVESAVVHRERDRLRQEVAQRVDELFPGIGPLVRPRAQVERALDRLRGAGSDRFVAMMAEVSPLFSGAADVQVQSLVFADGVLDVELLTPSLADLEALQRQVRARGMRAELGDVEVRETDTRGRLSISGENP